jgi:hypothetical protein
MMEQGGEPLLLVFPGSLPHTMQSLGHPLPALGRSSVRFHDVLLGHGPPLHHLRRWCFHPLCSAASPVLCLCSTPRWRACLDCAFGFPDRSGGLVGLRLSTRSLGSRAFSFSTCVWLLDYAGPDENSRCRFRQCGLPAASPRSAPVDASVYTSPGASRRPEQDSEVKMVRYSFLVVFSSPTTRRFIPDDCAL